MSKEEYLKNLESINKMVGELREKTNINPVEVYNRFALLFLERMQIDNGKTKRAEFMSNDFKYAYAQCKLAIGTMMLAHINGVPMSPLAFHVKNEAAKNGWVLRHYDPIECDVSNCVEGVRAAFLNLLGLEPRSCDVRICLQLGSPALWKEAKPNDFVLIHNDGEELQRINGLADTIMISEVAFPQELARYINEHMKKELNKEEKLAIYKNVRLIMRGES